MLAGFAISVLVLLASPASSVSVQDLTAFFESTEGLSMSWYDASRLASKEQQYLTHCGVTIVQLQALRNQLYTVMDLSPTATRQQLLPLAYQHASPTDLAAFYQTLSSISGLGIPKQLSQTMAISLAWRHADPYILGPLYQELSSAYAIALPLSQAQDKAISFTFAGVDAATLRREYLDSRHKYGATAALDWAVQQAAIANLGGLEQRYAKNGQLYTARGFQDYYKTDWLKEWNNAPVEKRTAPDGIDYRPGEYKFFFGSKWSTYWAKSKTVAQRRISKDGQTYTLSEFVEYYKDSWQIQWFEAYEVLNLCAGLNQESCSKYATCQWFWKADWTTSCVPRPLQETKNQEVHV